MSKPDTRQTASNPVPRALWIFIGVGMVLIVAMMAVIMNARKGAPRPGVPPNPMALQFVGVDDEHEIADAETQKQLSAAGLPRGLSFRQEQVSVGPEETRVNNYALLVKGDDETMDVARARLEVWAKSLGLPAGDRAAVGRVFEQNEVKGVSEPIGWRTYLLKGAPVLTAADVVDAHAMPDPNQGMSGWVVAVAFGPEGATRFEQYTAANIKRRFAILRDGNVESAPLIQSAIPGGRATITIGHGSPEEQKVEAESLAKALGGR
jgi:preprotein translocase subunit SecD